MRGSILMRASIGRPWSRKWNPTVQSRKRKRAG